MRFSPLQCKTSELEEEEYTSRLVSGIKRLATKLNRQRLRDLIWLTSSAKNSKEIKTRTE
jgi:hypothetical protein